MSDDLILRERRGPVLLATLNRPTKGNALNRALLGQLSNLVADLERSCGTPVGVRALVLTGAGTKTFSAGADVTELDGIGGNGAREQMRFGQMIFDRLEALPIPVLAAVNGYALGGGLELAMACDIRLAAPTALVGQPEINLGNVPGWGGTQRLPRLVGRGRANEMIFGGQMITAQRAAEIGLVNAVEEDAVAAALAMAMAFAAKSPIALRGAKRAIAIGLQSGLTEGQVVEADAVGVCCDSEEQQQALAQFLQRRTGK